MKKIISLIIFVTTFVFLILLHIKSIQILQNENKQDNLDPIKQEIKQNYGIIKINGCEFIINTYWGGTQAIHHPKCKNHWYSILK